MRWRKYSIIGFVLVIIGFGWVLEGMAFEIVSPKERAQLEVGKSYVIQVKPGRGEEKGWTLLAVPDEKFKFNPTTGMYEWILHLPKDGQPGSGKLVVYAVHAEWEGDIEPDGVERIELTRNLSTALPPTTVISDISATIGNMEKAYLTLYRHANGNLIRTHRGAADIYVWGEYTDEEVREITTHPGTTYASSDEKVVKVAPPGKWVSGDKSPEDPDIEREADRSALAMAVGPGTADIIVRNGPHETKVTAVVNIKPCSEWRRFKGDLPLCD